MYPGSTTSSAYTSRRGVSSSSSSRRDERLSSGPLTNERVMMEQIRSKLEKTQRRIARDRAAATSQHGYNSTSGAPMSVRDMGIASSRSTSSRQYQSSRSAYHQRNLDSSAPGNGGSGHYFPPDYRSARAPAVQSVYLEDLPMTIHSNQRAGPPSRRAPTSYAPGSGAGGHAPPPSTVASYYAPSLDETMTTRSYRSTTRHVRSHHHHHEATPRSERHGGERLEHHHYRYHQHQAENPEKSSKHTHHQLHRQPSDRTQPEEPSHVPPPPSTTSKRGILRKTSSLVPPPPSATMPLSEATAPPSSSLESDTNETVVAAPPPSSRVRFQDELFLEGVYPPLVEEDENTDDSDPEPLGFLGEEMPYDPKDDFEYDLDGIDEEDEEEEEGYDVAEGFLYADSPVGRFEAALDIKEASAVVNEPSRDSSPMAGASSSDKDAEIPPRRRGSTSAASRTPPHGSPSASYMRKSLTEPPKSAIDASMFGQFDMRERRASREKRLSNASESDVPPVWSSEDTHAADALAPASSSPSDAYTSSDYGDYSGSPRFSNGSLHESDLAEDDMSPHEVEKLSPSSTEDYCDARTYSEDEHEDQNRAPQERQSSGEPSVQRDGEKSIVDSPTTSAEMPPGQPMPLSQSLMLDAPPSTTRSGHRPPPASTHIRPSPATARFSRSMSLNGGTPRAPRTADGALAASSYVPRRLRTKDPASQLRKAMPPSIGALSGLASGPVTFELNVESFYDIVWHTGEFGFSFQRVYLEHVDASGAPCTRRMFLRMLLNTERATCPSFKQVHVGDVLVEIGDTRVCDIKLDKIGGGAALTKLFTELRTKTPLRLVFQRMDSSSWEGGVEL